MIVLVHSSWISWWIVCPFLWIVCLHYFFHIYIFIWSFYPAISFLGQKHTHKIMIDIFFFKNKDNGSLSIKLFNFIMDCLSFYMECLSSLLLPYIHLHLIFLSINSIFRQNKYIKTHKWHLIPPKKVMVVLAYNS